MPTYRRPRGSDWIAGLVAGGILGILLLGVGGRLGMRIIALAQGQIPSMTFEGSLTVVLLGAVSGVAIASIFLLSRALFPNRRPLRVAFFWVAVGAIVLRGLRPLTVLNAVVFMPLFVIHGSLLYGYWCRVRCVGRPLSVRVPNEEL
jgi:hypothetical protein